MYNRYYYNENAAAYVYICLVTARHRRTEATAGKQYLRRQHPRWHVN